ncbi:DUF1653 domain-containing protein [Kineothrix sp. MB12-C1]|uniref:DUF1653 domain-containing protein n=1 Tax=Kineothrix sp. MB12-C1 TaxID=3070215 RepID=UPI0027D22E59|nr:DUF1653 domain-containing protein [Kineothrix sp. MB12-C1]WMC92013.1 DUF1653 domain-containing protein [Kineothrix sp. MB12-C1]
MQHIPQAHEIYKHFKGNHYQIITIAKHSETGEMLVIYQAMYGDYGVYARPMDMFLEKVDKEKYPQASQEYRFEVVSSDVKDGECFKAVDLEIVEKKVDERDVFGQEMKANDAGSSQVEANEESLNIDPMVIEFLDADNYEERLNILTGLRHRITDDMINVMAIATDVEVKPGPVEERYEELRNCLLTFERFEGKRLR